MNKSFRIVVAVLMGLVLSGGVLAAPAVANTKPAGVSLVLHSECQIDLNNSVYWNGTSEDLAAQIAWLVAQLPEECLEDQCVFTNISLFYYHRLTVPWFMESLLEEFRDAIIENFRACFFRVDTSAPISGAGVGLGCGGAGNNLVLRIKGNNNSVFVSQVRCDDARVIVTGNGNSVILTQLGKDAAVVRINGSNIVFELHQRGEQTFDREVVQSQVVVQKDT